MSLFQVQLQNIGQGQLDLDPSTDPLVLGTAQKYGQIGEAFGYESGAPSTYSASKQRQVYVMGPKKINRLLKDGDTFTDCNYWKRFAAPPQGTAPYDQAFIKVLSDDGSVYSDVEEENTYAVGKGTWTINSTDWATTTHVLDFVTTYGGPAKFLLIDNYGGQTVQVELNGDANVRFSLPAANTQVFNSGDLAITMVRFISASGSTINVVASVKSAVNS